jgi:hypothetical protein
MDYLSLPEAGIGGGAGYAGGCGLMRLLVVSIRNEIN